MTDVVSLFAERLGLQHVEVRRVTTGGVAAAVAKVCVARRVHRVGVPPALPCAPTLS